MQMHHCFLNFMNLAQMMDWTISLMDSWQMEEHSFLQSSGRIDFQCAAAVTAGIHCAVNSKIIRAAVCVVD